jgi:hypothetical protein
MDCNCVTFLQLLDGCRGKVQSEIPFHGLQRQHTSRVIDHRDSPSHGVLPLHLGPCRPGRRSRKLHYQDSCDQPFSSHGIPALSSDTGLVPPTNRAVPRKQTSRPINVKSRIIPHSFKSAIVAGVLCSKCKTAERIPGQLVLRASDGVSAPTPATAWCSVTWRWELLQTSLRAHHRKTQNVLLSRGTAALPV